MRALLIAIDAPSQMDLKHMFEHRVGSRFSERGLFTRILVRVITSIPLAALQARMALFVQLIASLITSTRATVIATAVLNRLWIFDDRNEITMNCSPNRVPSRAFSRLPMCLLPDLAGHPEGTVNWFLRQGVTVSIKSSLKAAESALDSSDALLCLIQIWIEKSETLDSWSPLLPDQTGKALSGNSF
jgi:hypothetical protein